MTVQQRHPPGKYRLTVDDFLRLDEADVFGTDRTELLDGEIIIMNAEHRPHARVAGEIGYLVRRTLETLESGYCVLSGSVALSDHDMPLPDLVLTREPDGDGPIPASSIGLVAEVSTSTLTRDMHGKRSLYARACIPEYWVVDVSGRVIHQMWEPRGDEYLQSRRIAFGSRIDAATVAGLGVETATL